MNKLILALWIAYCCFCVCGCFGQKIVASDLGTVKKYDGLISRYCIDEHVYAYIGNLSSTGNVIPLFDSTGHAMKCEK